MKFQSTTGLCQDLISGRFWKTDEEKLHLILKMWHNNAMGGDLKKKYSS